MTVDEIRAYGERIAAILPSSGQAVGVRLLPEGTDTGRPAQRNWIGRYCYRGRDSRAMRPRAP